LSENKHLQITIKHCIYIIIRCSIALKGWAMTRIISLISVLLVLSSCGTTKKLWKEDSYTESVKQFSFEQNGTKLLAVGSRYHYVFDGQESLIKILESDFRKEIRPSFHNFYAVNDKISGEYTLKINFSDKNSKKYKWLLDNGFTEVKGKLQKKDSIKGKRYKKSVSESELKAYDKPYYITVKEKHSLGKKAFILAASPIAITADGVAGLAQGAGYVVAAPFVIIIGWWFMCTAYQC